MELKERHKLVYSREGLWENTAPRGLHLVRLRGLTVTAIVVVVTCPRSRCSSAGENKLPSHVISGRSTVHFSRDELHVRACLSAVPLHHRPIRRKKLTTCQKEAHSGEDEVEGVEGTVEDEEVEVEARRVVVRDRVR